MEGIIKTILNKKTRLNHDEYMKLCGQLQESARESKTRQEIIKRLATEYTDIIIQSLAAVLKKSPDKTGLQPEDCIKTMDTAELSAFKYFYNAAMPVIERVNAAIDEETRAREEKTARKEP